MCGDISIGGVVGGGKTHWGLGGRQKDSQPHKGQILDYGTGGERASAFAFLICFAAFTALLNGVFLYPFCSSGSQECGHREDLSLATLVALFIEAITRVEKTSKMKFIFCDHLSPKTHHLYFGVKMSKQH